MRVGLVTCVRLPEPDPDHRPLVEALARRGIEAVSVAWDGTEETQPVDVYVLRSTWNYFKAPEAFLSWVAEAASRAPLINPPEVVRWNIHKGYLAALQRAGVPIVPTRWYARGDRIDVPALLRESGWRRMVVKPAISAGSFCTRAFAGEQAAEAQRFAEGLLAERDVLVQEHLAGFADPGERALVWIGGEWTHAVRKRPRFAGQHERVGPAVGPSPVEREIADAAIAPLMDRLCYGRVDMVPDAAGRPVVSEVELMEPSLFFDHGPPRAIERFIDRIAAVSARASRSDSA